MKKRVKSLIGLCLVAALAFGGVANYAQAFPLQVTDDYGRVHAAECSSEIGQTSGSAYTISSGTSYGYCYVNATFRWMGRQGISNYSNGNSAAGMHGASVSMSHNKGSSAMKDGEVNASHTLTETATGNSASRSTGAGWLG